MKKIHSIFHISLLEKTKTKTTAPLATHVDLADDEGTEYEVEAILDFKRVSGKPHYLELVKWK